MPTRVLRLVRRVPKAAAVNTVTVMHHQANVLGKSTATSDEFGLLTYNIQPKQRAAEKRMLQPPPLSEPPTAHDDGDDEDEISSPPEKRVSKSKKRCSVEGCTKGAVRKGICWRHGAKHSIKRKRCSIEGCTNQVQKRGLCKRHGAFRTDAISAAL